MPGVQDSSCIARFRCKMNLALQSERRESKACLGLFKPTQSKLWTPGFEAAPTLSKAHAHTLITYRNGAEYGGRPKHG
jgi:hypothetical protein